MPFRPLEQNVCRFSEMRSANAVEVGIISFLRTQSMISYHLSRLSDREVTRKAQTPISERLIEDNDLLHQSG
jgi:hypothetical protein